MSADLEPIGPVAVAFLEDHVRQRSRDLITRCNGLEEAGMPELAHEGAFVAERLLDTLDQLAAERSTRIALQARCEELQAILGKATYQACGP